MKVLLIQVRSHGDAMAAHEEACVRRRLETSDHSFELAVRNTLVQPADPRWLDGADAFVIGGSGAFSQSRRASLLAGAADAQPPPRAPRSFPGQPPPPGVPIDVLL